MTRLLLADGHRSFVEALGELLAAEPSFEVVVTAGDAEAALRGVRAHPVDVAVLTVDGGVGDGCLAVARELVAARPGLKLVAVAQEDDVALLARTVREGFRGWVTKSRDVASFLDVLNAVARGETSIPPLLLTQLLAHLLHEDEKKEAAENRLDALTARERQVLEAIATGASRQAIAEELDISPNTLRTHLQSILGKLEVHTALAAIAVVRRGGAG
jgi:DNA-binding NarL/FixJ family response regulator